MANTNSVESMIQNVITVVLRIHFYYVYDEDLINDLKQEGYLKAYELLAEGNYDPTRSLRTYIYTGVRNAMTNYMYHTRKESHSSIDDETNQTWQNNSNLAIDGYYRGKIYYEAEDVESECSIKLSTIKSVCYKYWKFGDYFNPVVKRLKSMGLINYNIDLEPTDEKHYKDITDYIVCEILYKSVRE